jgi:hypothetical protein
MADPDVRSIAEAAQKLSDEELLRLIGYLSADYKDRQKRADQQAALNLRPGDEVETTMVGRNLPVGSRGRVLHLARSRVHVDFADHGVWAVLARGLKKITTQDASSGRSASNSPDTR